MPVMLALVVMAFAGCERNPAVAESDRDTARIVSLSPALSRMLVDLGLGERIVGRTPFCAAVDQAVPVVGDLRVVHYEDLVAVRPTHVLVQAPADGAPAALRELAREQGWSLHVWSGLDDLEDIAAVLDALPGALATPGSAAHAELAARVEAVRRELDAALLVPAAGWTGRVLLVHATDPVGVFGVGTYLGDVLERLGAVNAAPGAGWLSLSLEDVVHLDPEGVILILPGVDARVAPRDVAGALAELDIAAAREGRIGIVRGADALLPSTSIVGLARELRAILDGWASR